MPTALASARTVRPCILLTRPQPRCGASNTTSRAAPSASAESSLRFKGQPGAPDGSCVDAEGFIWNAQWNGRRVVRFAPDGRLDHIIEMPVLNPTCVAFGGAELDTLYITTARYLMTAEQLAADPQSGALFAFRPGVKGLPDEKFAG